MNYIILLMQLMFLMLTKHLMLDSSPIPLESSSFNSCKMVSSSNWDLCRFMQVTLWIQPVSQLLEESFINNQFSASPGCPSLFCSEAEGARSFVNSSQETAHFSTQNDSLLLLFVTDVI